MPEFYSDDNGNRVIIRHKGPPGQGIPDDGEDGLILVKDGSDPYKTRWAVPPDGTDAVTGPNSSVDGHMVVFNGTTGKRIKSASVPLSHFATRSYAETKQDAISGKGLSTNDFTDLLKNKLDNLSPGGFRGVFSSYLAITEHTFTPVAQAGDYCYIEVGESSIVEVLWDSTNEVWVKQTLDAITMTGSQIATALFNSDDAGSYDQAICRIFTSTEKGQIAAHETIISAFTAGLSGYQPVNAKLTAFSALGASADQIPYFNSASTLALSGFTGVGRNLVGAADVAAQLTALTLSYVNDVTFKTVKTEAPASGTAKKMKFGAVTAITNAGMVALGFTSQQQIDVDGTSYWTPLKTSAWA